MAEARVPDGNQLLRALYEAFGLTPPESVLQTPRGVLPSLDEMLKVVDAARDLDAGEAAPDWRELSDDTEDEPAQDDVGDDVSRVVVENLTDDPITIGHYPYQITIEPRETFTAEMDSFNAHHPTVLDGVACGRLSVTMVYAEADLQPRSPWYETPPGGQSINELAERVAALEKEIKAQRVLLRGLMATDPMVWQQLLRELRRRCG